MKKRTSFVLLAGFLLFAAPIWAQNDTLKVLFIGNSHTYTNDLPQLFVNLALSGGWPTIKGMNALPAYTLEQHRTNPTTLEMISRGTWNYVVLQDHSLYPIIDYYRFGSMYPSARALDSLITAHGQQTAIFMTWGRPTAGQWCLSGHCTIDFEDYFQMQDSVSVSCQMIADELSAVLSPVGDAWATARALDSTVDLWQVDNIHPTLRGSYLAACVFYAIFFHASPVGLPYTAGLPSQDALFLQRAADQTVLVEQNGPLGRPESFNLFKNYPNPFNSSTTLMFELPREEYVRLAIYDILGHFVRTLESGKLPAGSHNVTWDGENEQGNAVSSGVYFSVLNHGAKSDAIRLLLLK